MGNLLKCFLFGGWEGEDLVHFSQADHATPSIWYRPCKCVLVQTPTTHIKTHLKRVYDFTRQSWKQCHWKSIMLSSKHLYKPYKKLILRERRCHFCFSESKWRIFNAWEHWWVRGMRSLITVFAISSVFQALVEDHRKDCSSRDSCNSFWVMSKF